MEASVLGGGAGAEPLCPALLQEGVGQRAPEEVAEGLNVHLSVDGLVELANLLLGLAEQGAERLLAFRDDLVAVNVKPSQRERARRSK